MDEFINAIKGFAGGLDSQRPGHRWGIVQSVDAANHLVRVTIQPENLLTGWLPIVTMSAGNGWGILHIPLPGTIARLEPEDGHDAGNLVVTGFAHNINRPPPQPKGYLGSKSEPLQPGETFIGSETGTYIRIRSDGAIEMIGNVYIQGNLVVSGDVSDLNSAHQTLNALRQAYDTHTHPDPQGGNTSLPSKTV